MIKKIIFNFAWRLKFFFRREVPRRLQNDIPNTPITDDWTGASDVPTEAVISTFSRCHSCAGPDIPSTVHA